MTVYVALRYNEQVVSAGYMIRQLNQNGGRGGNFE